MDGRIIEVFEISGSLSPTGSIISGQLSGMAKITGEMTIPEVVYPASVYDEAHEFTPSDVQQVAHTANKLVEQDIIINPIPSNYGLVTWDGSTLTVS